MSMYYVYRIKVDGVIRYIGITNNLHRRQLQHRRDFRNNKDKYLYNKMREVSPDQPEIILEKIWEGDKGDAKRMEAFLILRDYFSEKKLWQSFPITIKYF